MGAGKSTVGRALAKSLGRAFADLDDEVTLVEGRSPAQIIDENGEAAFRDVEARTLARVGAADGRVVALGGGTLERDENLALVLRNGRLVYLSAPVDTLVERTTAAGAPVRPLLRGDAAVRMAGLLSRREPSYARAEVRVETEGRGVDAIVSEIEAWLAARAPHADGASDAAPAGPLERVDVALGASSYPIFIGCGERHRLGGLVRDALPRVQRAVLVADDVVGPRYADEACASLLRASIDVVARVVVPAGEGAKSIGVLSRLYDEVLGVGIDRRTAIVALGGGVVGDLAGFAAATLLRGLPLVQVPTTLLAQVDSSVGGKTGINHDVGKNLIGAFHQPSLVFIDLSYLRTLPLRDVRAGLAEVVKYGVIADDSFFEHIERSAEAIAAGDLDALLPCVRRSCELKAAIVAEDERETTGARQALNFGHTFGHALERLTGYGALRHGEAVAIGMCFAAHASARLGVCGADVPARIESVLRRLGLPTRIPFEEAALAMAMRHDKKALGAKVSFVLVEGLGRVRHGAYAPEEMAEKLRGLS
jgi:3-dehydroquinate synthase